MDDILENLDRAANFSSSESITRDHEALTRFWVAERSAPEVLPWPADLMERMLERVRKQIEKIEDLTSSTSLSPTLPPKPNLNLTLSILQTDLSRTQYLIRSLLRQRLSKLTSHPLHYLSLPQSQPPTSTTSILSPSEHTFLTHHQSLLSSHYSDAFLSAFPPQLQRLDDNAGGLNMVEGPDTKGAVFVRCLVGRWDAEKGADGGEEREDWEIEQDDDDYHEGRRGGGGGGSLKMRIGEVWVVRWEDVKQGVEAGKLELL
ncbi:MAG: hypothetical protein Q9227_002367 [Pyrenula ochraceoflavens]